MTKDWAAEMPPFLFQVVPAPQGLLAFSIRIIVAHFDAGNASLRIRFRHLES
jgi:hypothetical protein